MKSRIAVAVVLVGLAVSISLPNLSAQANSAQQATVASVLNSQLSAVERELVPAAEAMPAEKYEFAPAQGEFNGVRNFGSQLKHVAAVNYMIGGAILGEKPLADIGSDENGAATVKSKDEIVKYLKDSFTYLHKAMNSISAANMLEPIQAPWGDAKTTRLAMSVLGVGHPFDHYGQVVEYLRMNGIVPPASRM